MASDICIENGKLFFLNFSGAASRFNKEGRREFSVAIPLDLVDDLVNDAGTSSMVRTRTATRIPRSRTSQLRSDSTSVRRRSG